MSGSHFAKSKILDFSKTLLQDFPERPSNYQTKTIDLRESSVEEKKKLPQQTYSQWFLPIRVYGTLSQPLED